MEEEAKTQVEEQEQSLDEQMDASLDKIEQGKETPTSTSEETKPEGEEKETETTPEPDSETTEKVDEVEKDESLSVHDKIAKVAEILGDDLEAIDAYVKEKGYHNDPAWKAQRSMIARLKEAQGKGELSEEDKALIDNAKNVTSSREYIQVSMKEQGFTQEAIDKALVDAGYEAIPKPEGEPANDFELVTGKLNLDPKTLSKGQKEDIEDFSKVARIVAEDIISKVLPDKLNPVNEFINKNTKSESAATIVTTMKDTITKEGILDYTKDIEPAINKFMDENPKATQEDVFRHFKEESRRLSMERLKISKKKGERDDKKGNLRQIKDGSKVSETLPDKTGDYEQDSENLFDSLNYH